MRPSSSPSEPAPSEPSRSESRWGALFHPLFDSAAVDREVDDAAWLRAMLDAERGLVLAQARLGLVPGDAARRIAECAEPDRFDLADLGCRAVASGNPVVPLVRDLTALVGPEAAPYVHLGATSQDVLDTAAALVAHRALGPLLADLRAAADACARLAEEHGGTLMAARTLLQQALPTTFGRVCAGWLVALDESTAGLAAVRQTRLAVQYGGAAGTLASLGDAGVGVLGAWAEQVGLAEPTVPWHTDRVRVGQLAGALGTVAGTLAKIALDVLLLAQTEVGEVSEAGGEGQGGSSAMPHKRNPVRAVLVSAGTRRIPGLVATLLAAMAQEHERAAGSWHAEWETLTETLRLTGGAAATTRDLLCGLRVDAGRMRRNLEVTGGLLLAESVTARLAPTLGRTDAHDLVAKLCREAVDAGLSLRDVLLAEPAVTDQLSPNEVDAALDPGNYLGSAGAFVHRALAAHSQGVQS